LELVAAVEGFEGWEGAFELGKEGAGVFDIL
jgi:hypothetical protein